MYTCQDATTLHEEKVKKYMEDLRDKPIIILELATTTPGGPTDAPFAPIDPTLYEASMRLAYKLNLIEEVILKNMRNYGLI